MTPRYVTAAPASKPSRWEPLDVTKGGLIVIMVLYHWAYYFLQAPRSFYDALRFITPSFIFITGLLVTVLQVQRYGLSGKLYKKLLIRGTKLLSLFVTLNLAITILLPSRSRSAVFGLPTFTSDALTIFLSGNSASASFRILLPISYTLIFSIFFVQALRLPTLGRSVIIVLIIAAMQVLETVGHNSLNLIMITFGCLGIVVGPIGLEKINSCTKRIAPLLICYGAYVALLWYAGPLYTVQVIAVVLNLLLLYALLTHSLPSGYVRTCIALLGQYSLFAYITHIAFLQALLLLTRPLSAEPLRSAVALGSTLCLTFFVVAITDTLRRHFNGADRAYRAVFA